MKTKYIFTLITVVVIAVTALGMTANPVKAASATSIVASAPANGGFDPQMKTKCDKISTANGNVAQPNNADWMSCFVGGYVNWVVGTDAGVPIPDKVPAEVQKVLDTGAFLQLTEPWNSGCDNSIANPNCSIGFLKLFSDWGTMRAFLVHGEFEQAGITKHGPWHIYSLWITHGYVQVAEGDKISAEDKNLVCTGAEGLVFATDGGFPLPTKLCDGDNNSYALFEAWNGGCIGNVLPDVNCNVGQVKVFDSYDKLIQYLSDNGWNRGSVWANRPDLVETPGIAPQPAGIQRFIANVWSWIGDNIVWIIIGFVVLVILIVAALFLTGVFHIP